MQVFSTIYDQAVARSGPESDLRASLPVPLAAEEIRKLSDAFCLSNMSRRIFQAGLSQKMIDNKWPAFEQAFHGFDIDAVRMMSDEALDSLMHNRNIVRHWGKIQSVRYNAQTIHEINEEEGGFTDLLADWPADDIVSLWKLLKQRFKQLGGASGPFFLRRVRKDTFLLTDDVVRALGRWGAIDFLPKSQTHFKQVQQCMNQWQQESALPYCQVSMVLARSID